MSLYGEAQPPFSAPLGFFMADDEQRGLSEGLYKDGSYNDATLYRDPIEEAVANGYGFSMSDIWEGGTYVFGAGTVSRPSVAVGENDSGLYSIGANNVGAAAGEALIFDWSATRVRLNTTIALQFGDDVSLSRGAANRLDLATGDDFNIVLGNFQIGATTVFESDRDFAVSLIPNADNSLTVGSAARRVSTINFGTSLNWYSAASAANPVFYVGDDGGGNVTLAFGAGGASAVDVVLLRGAANRLDMASGDSLNLLSGTVTANSINLKDATNQIVIDSDGANTGTITMAALTAARVWTFPDATGTFAFGTGTANRVAYWSATNTLTGDADLTFDGTILTALQQSRCGTVALTATQGDWATGLTGAAYTFYDQSLAQQQWTNSSGTLIYELDAGSTPIFTHKGRTDADRTETFTSGTVNIHDWNVVLDPASNSTATMRGAFYFVDAKGTGINHGTIESIKCDTSITATGTTTLAIGFNMLARNFNGGTVTTAEGLRCAISNTGAGTITLGIGMNIEVPTNSGGGTFTTYEALRLREPPATITAANAYGLRQYGGQFVVNENGADWNARFEGDTLVYMLYLNGDAALENITLLATAEPNYQTMDRGLFIGNVTTAPTGNPTSGGFMYSNAGAGTWRGSGGTVTAFGPAGPHCGSCGSDMWAVAAINVKWKSWCYECGVCGTRFRGGPIDVRPMLDDDQKRELLQEGMAWEEVLEVLNVKG